MYELIIIGGGPSGVAAGVYAARKKIKTLLITESFGGQSMVSENIENWIGSKSISGYDLAKNLENHIRAQEGIELIDDDLVTGVKKTDNGFFVFTKDGKTFETKYIILASGSSRRKLNIPGDDKFEGKGVVYCSTCDAPLFKNKTVAVIGGGNSALESVVDLVSYASKVYLLVRSEILKGDPITQDAVKAHPNIKIIFNAVPQEIIGNDFVSGVKYKDAKTGELKELSLDGVFVEIGLIPNSDIVKGIVNFNEYGAVITNEKTQETSMPGIWAVGDVTDELYKQNNISVGDGIKAVLNVYDHLKSGK
jgi:alkyl hydroperoxide reductase subunit F